MRIPAQIIVAVFAFVCVASAQNAAPPSWTAELQIKTRAVGAPRVSPDGKRVVYTVSDAGNDV
jgi:hypothetical protein